MPDPVPSPPLRLQRPSPKPPGPDHLSILIVAGGVVVFALFVALAIWLRGGTAGGDANNSAAAEGADPATQVRAAVPDVVESGPSRVDYARLDERLRRVMAEPDMAGLAIGVVEDGQIRFLRGYGVTTTGSNDPVTPDTVFRWASVSKGVAADMVTLLAGQQRLSLADPVGRWVTSMRLPGGNEQRASVADMLSHTLGVHGHAHDPRLESGEDPHVLRSMLATLDQTCSPGTCHAYQNVAYDGASELVERITGTTYEQALTDYLFRPLGMRTASASSGALEANASWARPHGPGRPPRPEATSENYYRVPAAGGVNGSIRDLTLWMRANMGLAPEVLSPEVLTAVQTPRVNTPGETRRRARYRERTPTSAYAMGWRVFDYAGHRVVGHHGGVRGYRSMILFDPATKSGVVVLWNSSTGRPGGVEYEVMDALYGLPFVDWLQLDSELPAAGAASEGEEAGDAAARANPPASIRIRPDRRR